MEKTMKIEGMMCTHCEARVKKALEALDHVENAQVSHEAGTAVVTLSADVANDVLKNAVEARLPRYLHSVTQRENDIGGGRGNTAAPAPYYPKLFQNNLKQS